MGTCTQQAACKHQGETSKHDRRQNQGQKGRKSQDKSRQGSGEEEGERAPQCKQGAAAKGEHRTRATRKGGARRSAAPVVDRKPPKNFTQDHAASKRLGRQWRVNPKRPGGPPARLQGGNRRGRGIPSRNRARGGQKPKERNAPGRLGRERERERERGREGGSEAGREREGEKGNGTGSQTQPTHAGEAAQHNGGAAARGAPQRPAAQPRTAAGKGYKSTVGRCARQASNAQGRQPRAGTLQSPPRRRRQHRFTKGRRREGGRE